MKHLLKQPLFYTSLLSLVALFLIIGAYVFGWTTPTQNPPAGNVVLSSVTPGGSNGYVQFNNAGTFGGDANLFWDNTNKRLGIGTTTPAFSLDVIGTSRFFATSTFSGNVGIGTTAPSEKLEVAGNIKLSGSTPTYKITNVAAPTASSDVATKGYVDALGTTYSSCRILASSSNTTCNTGETAFISTSGTGCISADQAANIINLGQFGIWRTTCKGRDLGYLNQQTFNQIAQQSIIVRKLISGLKRIKYQNEKI